MAGVNKVMLMGNLGADPEVRHLESGSVVANISLATTENYTNRNGDRVEETEWHKVELWGKLAELAEKYLSKGRTVFIEGKIKSNVYQDKEGVNRKDIKVRALSMQFVGGRSETVNQNPQPAVADSGNGSYPGVESSDTDGNDDLPF